MEGYGPKPMPSEQSFQGSDGNFVQSEMGVAVAPPAVADEPVICHETILDRVDGDLELLEELVEIFLETSPEMLRNVREAARQEDADALHKAAHRFKGSVSNFAAQTAATLALELETRGRTGELTGTERLCDSLERELERVRSALVQFVKDPTP